MKHQVVIVAVSGLISLTAGIAAEERPGERPALGQKVFDSACKSCHDIANDSNGAPQLHDNAAWKDRQGGDREALYKSAIEGFTGYYQMPPKGGNTSLTDDEVKAAVDYILQQAGIR